MLPREVAQLFAELRRTGNAASHALAGDHRSALAALKLGWQLGLWYYRTFKQPDYRSGPFIPPRAPPQESAELKQALDRLNRVLEDYRARQRDTEQRLRAAEARLREAEDEQAFWEQMASEADQAKATLEARLAAHQAAAAARPGGELAGLIAAANAAQVLELDEVETRKLIDQQLRQAGWEADSERLRHGPGARPAKGRNRAIAEWPTAEGPADYVLFTGLTPLAVVEAKRRNLDVSAALQQAKRYSRGLDPAPELAKPSGPWGGYRIPFAFASNGRPYLRQLATRSGVWFCDLRQPDNLSQALDGWYTPEGLAARLKRDDQAAHQRLAAEPFAYGFALRPYQQAAIQAAKGAIAAGRREMLLAMATGTGKTKTCSALIYRLLKAQRFRRVLFLVGRSALGEQAANAFKDTRMESLQTFADIFGIKELDEQAPVRTPPFTSLPCRAWCGAPCTPPRRPRLPAWINTIAWWWTNATGATCSTASCRTPNWAFAASTTTSPNIAGCWSASMRSRSGSPPPRPCTPQRSSVSPSSPTATGRR